MRRNEKIRISNKSHLRKLRTRIKEFQALMDKNDIPSAQKMLPETISMIDKTVSKGIIHRNTGARYKSNLMGRFGKLSGGAKEGQ